MNKNKQGHLLALLTILIWGTTYISTKILLKEFKPIEILFFRFLLGFIVLSIIYPHRLQGVRLKQELTFACAGLCGITLYYLLENIALTYTMVSNVGVIISVAPLFTAILAFFLLDGEKLKVNFFIGFLAAITGIFLISYNTSSVFQLNPLGDLLALGAAVIWSIYSILSRKISNYGYNIIQTTRRVFLYGLVFMLPALFIFDCNIKPERFENPVNLLNMLFLGLGASALCFVTWNLAVRILGAVKTSIYIYMVPVISVITSVIILKEKVNGVTSIGILLTMSGLFISNKNTGKAESESVVNV